VSDDRLDYPIDEVAATALKWVREGATIYQKFTCAGCGSRQAMDVPNRLFTSGSCEACGHVTDIEARGCNYLVVTKVRA
jgi:hypothetical protein